MCEHLPTSDDRHEVRSSSRSPPSVREKRQKRRSVSASSDLLFIFAVAVYRTSFCLCESCRTRLFEILWVWEAGRWQYTRVGSREVQNVDVILRHFIFGRPYIPFPSFIVSKTLWLVERIFCVTQMFGFGFDKELRDFLFKQKERCALF